MNPIQTTQIRSNLQTVKRERHMTLDSVYSPTPNQPFRALIYGPEKVGKSSWAINAPNPIFISGDDGLGLLSDSQGRRAQQLPVPRDYQDIIDGIEMLTEETHKFETLVLDPLGWFEPLIFAEYIRRFPKLSDGSQVKDINDYGYFKGQSGSVDIWRSLIASLERLRAVKSMNLILVAHSQVKVTSNPMGGDFERYCLQLDGGAKSERAAGKLAQWPDAVLFVSYASVVKNIKGKNKGIGNGTRVVHTQPCDAFHAGNRYGLPAQLPLDFAEFYAHITGNRDAENVESLRAQSLKLIEGTDFEATAKVAIEAAGANQEQLRLIINRATQKLSEQQEGEISDD
jgi:hypothetical protein